MVSNKPAAAKPDKDKRFKNKSSKVIKKKPKIEVPETKTMKNDSKTILEQTPAQIAPKKIKYVMPSKYITEGLVTLSLEALDKVVAYQNKRNVIFGDETSVFLEIRCIKIQNSRGNIKFVLPHSTVESSGEVCLITPDLRKGKRADHEPTVEHWEEILKNAGVTEVKTVLPMRQLRVEYDQFELKRRLMTQHDFIMVDTRVLNHVSHVLGKMFFKKHNMLIPVKINEKSDIKKNIGVGLRTAMLRLSEGETSTFLVGHTGMPHRKIKENIISFIQQLKNKFPGGEANIRSIALKLPLSLSLPLYITLRSSNTIAPPKLKKSKPKHFIEYEDELSTIPGSKVMVAPDGTVILRKSSNENDDSNTEEEEKEEVVDNESEIETGNE